MTTSTSTTKLLFFQSKPALLRHALPQPTLLQHALPQPCQLHRALLALGILMAVQLLYLLSNRRPHPPTPDSCFKVERPPVVRSHPLPRQQALQDQPLQH